MKTQQRMATHSVPLAASQYYAICLEIIRCKEQITRSELQRKRKTHSIGEIGNLIPMRVPSNNNPNGQSIVDLNIVAEGPTQTLVLSNYKPSKKYIQAAKGQTSQTSVATGFEVKVENSDVTFKAQLRLGGVGISLINQNMKELLYCTFREIEIKLRGEQRVYQTLDTTIKMDPNRQSAIRRHFPQFFLSQCRAQDWKGNGGASYLPSYGYTSQGRFVRCLVHRVCHVALATDDS